MADLKTNYVDDKLDVTKNQIRKYRQIQNDDGTVSFVDVTEYTQVGTSFGAKDINDTNAAINEVTSNLALKAKKYYSHSDGMFTVDRAYNAGLVDTGQPPALESTMWLILAQRISVSDSCVLLGNFYGSAWHLTEIQKSPSMSVQTNNQGTISVMYGGSGTGVLLTAIRLQ